MNPLQKRLNNLRADFDAAMKRLDIDARTAELTGQEKQLEDPDIWRDPKAAQDLSRTVAAARNQVQPWLTLRTQIADIGELLDLGDDELLPEVETQLTALEQELLELRKQLLFRGEYDNHDAILRLSAGAGGDDAQDFTEMLERMYLRWAEKSGFTARVIERSAGETAGVKTSVIEIAGSFAYGKLRSENGVHRLVRLSPFNAESRETSFALVEVLPKIDAPDAVKIDPNDLKIDVYRAGGHGGQSVNTTDSAVRITHLPTGVVVAIQNERSQLQNREKAMEILRGKLVALQMEQHAESLSDLRAGESAAWGAQIRNYVLHPYKLVKDTRTNYEEKDVDKVLGGEIDGFIEAYLESQTTSEKS
ncbi:MAG: peptide chain release factor 2 [Candidatus Nomurabacteria bacterium]|jgi:peptide chain release factor 2|nr:peptide chain release factor 2 [Candidatus Nomurabacteria bacterium]